ncbi:hypothetical protein ARMGADRAFT_1077295 [Armillaria gallica]|uniref:Uncharacterized protein n=1 Tax=Armillaria gallica TaxID=47427 RepID=A0A2H3E349_ARMGA|nr:hypothetical protein ARMGADRAFT_1077295 [Armillaria gallica]
MDAQPRLHPPHVSVAEMKYTRLVHSKVSIHLHWLALNGEADNVNRYSYTFSYSSAEYSLCRECGRLYGSRWAHKLNEPPRTALLDLDFLTLITTTMMSSSSYDSFTYRGDTNQFAPRLNCKRILYFSWKLLIRNFSRPNLVRVRRLSFGGYHLSIHQPKLKQRPTEGLRIAKERINPRISLLTIVDNRVATRSDTGHTVPSSNTNVERTWWAGNGGLSSWKDVRRSNSGTRIRRRTAAVSRFKTMGRRGVVRVFVGCENGCTAETASPSFAEMKYTCYVHLKISVLFLSLSRSIPRAEDVPSNSFLGSETNLWLHRTTLERPNGCVRKFEGAGWLI